MPVEIERVFSECAFHKVSSITCLPSGVSLAYFPRDRTFIKPELTKPELTDIVWNE